MDIIEQPGHRAGKFPITAVGLSLLILTANDPRAVLC